MLIRKNGKKVSVLLVLLVLFFVLEKNLYVLYNPVDEKDDENGDGCLAPHAVAAQTPDGGTAPDGGGAVESVDGETVLHDGSGTEETDTGDYLGEDAQVVVVDEAA